jgi:hypothetical protein
MKASLTRNEPRKALQSFISTSQGWFSSVSQNPSTKPDDEFGALFSKLTTDPKEAAKGNNQVY